MLKNCLSLTKILLRSLFDMSSPSKNKPKKKNKKEKKTSLIVLLVVLFLFCGVPFFLSGFALALALYTEDPTIAVSLWQILLPVTTILLIVMSIFAIVSVFFFSMDNQILLPLPLKSWEILVARFITAIIFVYYMELIFVAPILLGAGLGFNLSIFQFIVLLIICLCLPVFPVAFVGVIFTYLSRIINFSKYKDAYTYISMILAIGLSFGITSFMSYGESNMGSPEGIQSLIDIIRQSENSYIYITPFLIPGITALTNANIFTQILNLVLFLILNSIIVVIFLLLCNKPYYKTLKESGNNGGNKKKISKEIIIKDTKVTSYFKSGVLTEFKTIVRSPVFFSNTFLVTLIFPLIILITVPLGLAEEGIDNNAIFNELLPQIQGSTIGNSMVLLILLCVFMFFASMNLTSGTAISRMGKSAEFVKCTPIKPIVTINIKIFWGVALSLFTALIFVIPCVVLNIINILDALLLIILLLSLFVFDNYLSLFFDLAKPILNWDNENQAMKNNYNALWGMLLSFVILALIVILCIMLEYVQFGGYVAYAIILLASLLGNFLFYKYYSRSADKVFKNI